LKVSSFFNFVNNKLTCMTGIGALRNSENAIVTDDEQRANLLNEFFGSVCTVDNGIKPALNRDVANDVKIDSVTFTPAKVLHTVKKLKSSKSSGPDGYTTELFKKIDVALAEPLSLIYSSFMSAEQMPTAWAHAIVTPVFKHGDAADSSNYRSISLTTVASKIMERIISNDVLSFLHAHGLINQQQHGFMSGKSTCTNLLQTINARSYG
jgi:hypothetical protein